MLVVVLIAAAAAGQGAEPGPGQHRDALLVHQTGRLAGKLGLSHRGGQPGTTNFYTLLARFCP